MAIQYLDNLAQVQRKKCPSFFNIDCIIVNCSPISGCYSFIFPAINRQLVLGSMFQVSCYKARGDFTISDNVTGTPLIISECRTNVQDCMKFACHGGLYWPFISVSSFVKDFKHVFIFKFYISYIWYLIWIVCTLNEEHLTVISSYDVLASIILFTKVQIVWG